MAKYGPFTEEELRAIAASEREKWLDKSYDYWITLYKSADQAIAYRIKVKSEDVSVEICFLDDPLREDDRIEVCLGVCVKTKRSRFWGDTWRGVGVSWDVYRDGRVET